MLSKEVKSVGLLPMVNISALRTLSFCTLKSSDVADVIMVPKVLRTSAIGNEKCRGKGHENSALRPLVKFDFMTQQ